MRDRIVVLCCFLLLVGSTGDAARAGVVNFQMDGTYTNSDVTLSIAAGTPFTITGSYDTDLQPWVGKYVGPGQPLQYETIPDQSVPGVISYDCSQLISHDYGLLQEISQTYHADPKPFNVNEEADAEYLEVWDGLWGSDRRLKILDGYYQFDASVDLSKPQRTGVIDYGWYELHTPQGGGFELVEWKHRDLTFDVTDFRTTNAPNPVPEPATVLLLGSSLLCLAALRSKWRKA